MHFAWLRRSAIALDGGKGGGNDDDFSSFISIPADSSTGSLAAAKRGGRQQRPFV